MRDSPPPQLLDIAARVDKTLGELLEKERTAWREANPALDEPLADLSDFVMRGGKRIRPAYCYWGWVMAGGDPASNRVLEVCCALELLHSFALIHDDVMDGSLTRRSAPSVWAQYLQRHRDARWRGEPRRFAEGVAVLLGDIAMVTADRTLGDVSVGARRVWDQLRTELNMGQYLDVVGTAQGGVTATDAFSIVRYKTALYTIVRPLQLGAALADYDDLATGSAARVDLAAGSAAGAGSAPGLAAGADSAAGLAAGADTGEGLAADLCDHGLPLGVAFQLRDDLLGAFGDFNNTGKPVGDDLIEGKPTVLLALARETASASQLETLSKVGLEASPSAIASIQQVLVDTGAVAATETEIDKLLAEALRGVDALPDVGGSRAALRKLAHYVVDRSQK